MAYDDLREAIRTEVLVTGAQEERIIGADELSNAAWLFDFRALLLQPRWLKRYAEVFWEKFDAMYPFQVCGMESAAISLVAAVVMEGVARGKPVNGLFIRKSRKRHGLMKQLEGAPTVDPVILVDDLVNSGKTFEKQLKLLEHEGLEVAGMFTLLRFRDETAYAPLLENGKRELRALFSLKDFGISLEKPRTPEPQLEELWHFAAPEPSFNHVLQKSAPALDKERIYFGSDAGTFYALNQKDGSVAWKFETGKHPAGKGILSSPALYGGTVYFGAYDGNVYALDARTGANRWVYDDADWVGSSPALAPDIGVLFIGLEFGLFQKRGGAAALKLDTGELLWQHRSPEHTHGSPLYIQEKNMVVIGSNDEVVYAYRATTGEPLWRYRTRGSVKSSFAFDTARGLIFFGTLEGIFYALDTNGAPIFAKELGAGVYSTPLVLGDTVCIASLDKNVYAFGCASGALRWQYATSGRIFASPALLRDSIYIGSNDGCLHEIDAESGKGGPVFQATERIVNRIAYDPDTQRFFVPTVANELYCLR